ncbi:MAG TPA: HdeD family acid-resistance protein [Anaerolineales bacterium]|nr:HdeD family acid-resistance protein [Anaerolineales bacterium]
MFTQLFRNWWHFAVRGVLAIVFGVLALIWPDSTKLALVLLFGAFAFVDGIFAVTTGIATRGYFERWWAILLEGIAGIVIGVLTFFWPNITALVLLYFIAAWAVTTGIFEIVAAIEFRHVISGEWVMILAGLLSVLLGILLFVFPSAGMVSVVWLIGIYAIAAGIISMIFAFRLRGLGHKLGITSTANA